MNLNAVNSEIHMYIAGEEVVCDKEIVVEEKLLDLLLPGSCFRHSVFSLKCSIPLILVV